MTNGIFYLVMTNGNFANCRRVQQIYVIYFTTSFRKSSLCDYLSRCFSITKPLL